MPRRLSLVGRGTYNFQVCYQISGTEVIRRGQQETRVRTTASVRAAFRKPGCPTTRPVVFMASEARPGPVTSRSGY
eukprot:763329-Hanusia_phi.AAC.10